MDHSVMKEMGRKCNLEGARWRTLGRRIRKCTSGLFQDLGLLCMKVVLVTLNTNQLDAPDKLLVPQLTFPLGLFTDLSYFR